MRYLEQIRTATPAISITGPGVWWKRRGLPVRPRPFAGEWTYGYLVRVAQANGYPSPRALWSSLGPKRTCTASRIRHAFRLSSEEWSNLSGPWPRFCRTESRLVGGLTQTDYCHDYLRWCSYCLAEQSFIREWWVIKLCVVCPKHACFLRDTCPACHQAQRPERGVLARCACGASLLHTPEQAVPANELRVQMAFLHALDGQTPEGMPALTATAWIRLFHRIATLDDTEEKVRPGQVAGLHRLGRAITVNRQLADLIGNWPAGFHRYLAAKQQNAATSFSLVRTFGRLYRWLYRDTDGEAFTFLRDAFEAYLQEHWWGLLCKRNRRLGSKTTRSRKTVQTIAAEADTTPTRVKQLHLAGWIEADIAVQPSGRHAWSLPATQVAPIAALIADGLTLQQAAAYLRLPKHRVRELITSSLIKPRISTRQSNAAAWLISRQQLDDLRNGCAQHPLPFEPTEEPDCIPLIQMLKAWRLEAGFLTALLQALQSGELQPAKAAHINSVALGDMLIPRQRAKAWLAHWRQTHGRDYSITEAATLLGIKPQVAYQLVKHRHIHSVQAPQSGDQRIPQEAVETFNARFISLADIAKHLGTSPKQALRRLPCHPVTGPAVDGCRQYFYQRNDVAHLLFTTNPRS